MNEQATRTTPNPYFDPKPGTGLGAYVSYPFGVGRVFKVHFRCPQDDAWKAVQSYDVAAEEAKTERWVSILVHDGGSVVFPETLVDPVEPFVLRNQSAVFYFGKAVDDSHSATVARLRDFLDTLPQGHEERPGVLRAIEVLTYTDGE